MRLLLGLIMSGCAWAQIESPEVGTMLDADGRARPVFGAPAAAMVGNPWFDGAITSLACSAQGCLAKTESALFTPAGVVVNAPPGSAIIALDSSSPGAAYVYFVQSGKLARWTGSQLVPMDFAPGGDVLAMRAVAGGFEYAVERDGEIWIGGKSLGAANSVFLSDDGAVLQAVTDDSTVRFVATSTRVASFAVNAGATAITLNAQPNIVFSTGTTAGTLTFTADSGIYGLSGSPSISLSTPAVPIALVSSAATSRANVLDVVISGFDNTYSIGGMSFSFVDRSGTAIASIPADFSSDFQTYFKSQTAGSSFLMRVSFPVTGDVSQVGGVTVVLNNSAGAVTTPVLKFP